MTSLFRVKAWRTLLWLMAITSFVLASGAPYKWGPGKFYP